MPISLDQLMCVVASKTGPFELPRFYILIFYVALPTLNYHTFSTLFHSSFIYSFFFFAIWLLEYRCIRRELFFSVGIGTCVPYIFQFYHIHFNGRYMPLQCMHRSRKSTSQYIVCCMFFFCRIYLWPHAKQFLNVHPVRSLYYVILCLYLWSAFSLFDIKHLQLFPHPSRIFVLICEPKWSLIYSLYKLCENNCSMHYENSFWTFLR